MNFDYLKNKVSFKAGLGFQDLSDADKVLARQLTPSNAGTRFRTIESAPLLRYTLVNFRDTIKPDDYMKATESAIRDYSKMPTRLHILLENNRPPLIQDDFLRCFRIAGDYGHRAVWTKLKQCYDTVYPDSNIDKHLVGIAISRNLNDVAKEILQAVDPAAADVYYQALSTACTVNVHRLGDMLAFSGKFAKRQSRLDDLFFECAKENNSDQAKLLLEHGADVNTKNAMALYHAAKNDNPSFFNFLMKQNIDFEQYGPKILSNIKNLNYPPRGLAPQLQSILDAAQLKAEILKAEKERYSLPRPHILSDALLLPSGIKLTTLFNFESRQQIIITENKTTLTTVVTGFKDLENIVIEDALKNLRDRGGVASNDWMQKNHTKKSTLNKD
jgi:hypothetical protein